MSILRRLISYIRPYRGAFWIAFAILIFATAADMGGTYLVSYFIDHYLVPKKLDSTVIWGSIGAFILLHGIAAGFNFLQVYQFRNLANWVVRDIREKLFTRVQGYALSYFDRTPAGVIVSRITNDTENLFELYISVLSNVLYNAIYIIGIYVTLYLLDPMLATYTLFVLPLAFVLIYTYQRVTKASFQTLRQKISQMNVQLNESIQSMNIIQAFRQQKRMRERFDGLNQAHYQAAITNLRYFGLLLRPAMKFLSQLSLVLLILYFGHQSTTMTSVQVGVMYGFLTLLTRLFEPINEIMQRLTSLQQAVVSAERVFALLDHEEPAPEGNKEADAQIEEGRVEFRNVTFSYDGKTDVLHDISFVAEPGQTVALVGHTGSGKSTISQLLLRFYQPQKGEIYLDNRPLAQFADEELRNKTGYVLQEPFLFYGNIEHNIRLHQKEITRQEIQDAAEFVQAAPFIESFPNQYQEPVRERGANFSSGQRQLLSFARTMVRKPKILVLDEATASVDTETEEIIQSSLEKMRSGRTTIAIAHRLSTIQNADQILVLHRGRIVERGKHQELLAKKGLYYQMYSLQLGTEEPQQIEGMRK
ncbi:ABC transporter ATP-binding protein [Risungbinella massiliensis]|uniref:ABC transporter ATP-binding protein n=1 Tax=Risungbinella massiliensis TaxID=1329796 RepID=UPI0005CBAB07|nr:ABC transporter ATP-binding protein [Risungbinella massiliensis]